MSLRDLIYHCPFCGADTEDGPRGEARCMGCERLFELPRGDGGVGVVSPDGSRTSMTIPELMDRCDSISNDEGVIEAEVFTRFASSERPVWYRRSLVGYFEERGPAQPGRLRLDERSIRYRRSGTEVQEWALRDIRAVQTASAAVQISPLEGGLVSFRLLGDSHRRWETAIKRRLRAVWRSEGRGEIVEFQPRIRAE